MVLTLMQAGIPLSKLDCPGLRELLEENRLQAYDEHDTILTSGRAHPGKRVDSREACGSSFQRYDKAWGGVGVDSSLS